MKKLQKSPELSIIILNYNTKELVLNLLRSLKKAEKEANFEVIVVDNGSTDGSVQKFQNTKIPKLQIIENGKNLGFAAGNNSAKKVARGEYVLFLNSDTLVKKGAVKSCLEYLKNNSDVGAVTCKIVLPNGKLDPDTRRSFPTPWVSFTHFSGLDKLFPNSRLFSKYWYGYKSENEASEVEVIQGAFMMFPKKVLDSVNWFDEDYFLDGEDIDLCFKVWESGKKIIYYPEKSVIHLKKGTKKNIKLTLGERIKYRLRGVDAMEIFYRKRLWVRYPIFVNLPVILAIKILKVFRVFKILISKK